MAPEADRAGRRGRLVEGRRGGGTIVNATEILLGPFGFLLFMAGFVGVILTAGTAIVGLCRWSRSGPASDNSPRPSPPACPLCGLDLRPVEVRAGGEGWETPPDWYCKARDDEEMRYFWTVTRDADAGGPSRASGRRASRRGWRNCGAQGGMAMPGFDATDLCFTRPELARDARETFRPPGTDRYPISAEEAELLGRAADEIDRLRGLVETSGLAPA